MSKTILIVESDAALSRSMREALTSKGFSVEETSDGKGCVDLVRKKSPQLIVLAVDLSAGQNGYIICGKLKGDDALKATPVVIIGNPDGFAQHRKLKTKKADDYLAKPFEPQELVLRIGAILRRTGAQTVISRRLSLGRCLFDAERGELFRDEEPVRLTEAEAQLLKRLARAPNAPVERHMLGSGSGDAAGRAVDIQVTRLRRKIEADPKNPRYLQTVRGVGYMLAPD